MTVRARRAPEPAAPSQLDALEHPRGPDAAEHADDGRRDDQVALVAREAGLVIAATSTNQASAERRRARASAPSRRWRNHMTAAKPTAMIVPASTGAIATSRKR